MSAKCKFLFAIYFKMQTFSFSSFSGCFLVNITASLLACSGLNVVSQLFLVWTMRNGFFCSSASPIMPSVPAVCAVVLTHWLSVNRPENQAERENDSGSGCSWRSSYYRVNKAAFAFPAFFRACDFCHQMKLKCVCYSSLAQWKKKC